MNDRNKLVETPLEAHLKNYMLLTADDRKGVDTLVNDLAKKTVDLFEWRKRIAQPGDEILRQAGGGLI